MKQRQRALPAKLCGARTRSGGNCHKGAGWGTPHPGLGRCALHGGCTPAHIKHAAKLEALEFVAGHLGELPDVHPLEGALLAVRMAAGAVGFWRRQLAVVETPSPTQIAGYRMAMLDAARVSKSAIDAGVAEQQVRIAEWLGERIALAAEEALAAIEIEAEKRAEFVRVFSENLRRLEEQPIESTATDA